MVTATQTELKRLLSNQLASAHTKVITALIGATLSATITPLKAWDIPYIKAKNETEIINLISFISGLSCCGYAFIAASKVREYGGKLEMFNQLEKERFIQEQLIAQEAYLSELKRQARENYEQSIITARTLIPPHIREQLAQKKQRGEAQINDVGSPVGDDVATHNHNHTMRYIASETSNHIPTHTTTQPPTTNHADTIDINPNCVHCGSSETNKHQKTKDGYRYKCKSCDRTFGVT